MRVKNIGAKVIGFAGTKITMLPGEYANLPKEFGANHPSIMALIRFKFIEIAEDAEHDRVHDRVQSSAELNPPGYLSEPPSNEDKLPERKDTIVSGKSKPLTKMTLNELRDKALNHGIGFTNDDTRASLMRKINEALVD